VTERSSFDDVSFAASAAPRLTPGVQRLTLLLLTVTYGFGFIDRVVIALVAQDLKAEFSLSDFEIGLLGGSAFAIVNAMVTLPIAILAERRPRTLVAAASLAIGSLFTTLCAVAGSFAHLLGARLGMAVGSAGTEAPAHSAISDLYRPGQRASALSVFMLGVPIASILGSFGGGMVAQAFGWRATFLAFGGIGLLVAMAGAVLMREPRRGDLPDHSAAGPAMHSVIATLWRARHFRHILLATALVSFASFGVNTFLPAFFARAYGLDTGAAGLAFGVIAGIASAIGSVAGGFGSEWLARRRPELLIGGPGLGLIVGTPLLMFGVTRPNLAVALPIILVGSCFFYTAMAPAIATMHGLLDSRSRALGSALFTLIVYLIGQGLGPPLAGWASDRFAAWHYGTASYVDRCVGAAGQLSSPSCTTASAAGLRDAILCFALIYLLSASHFLLAARRMRAVSSPADEASLA